MGDCDDSDPDVHPDAADLAGNGEDENCDGVDGVDEDGDGVASTSSGGADCDDANATVCPSCDETPYDGVDQDCDGADLDDVDGDGYIYDEDCKDDDPAVHPDAAETCGNGVDDNCDGSAAECGLDGDIGSTDASAVVAGDLGHQGSIGTAVAVGDLTGDGAVNLIVGASNSEPDGAPDNAGAVLIATAALVGEVDLTESAVTLVGEGEQNQLGGALIAPDLDDDGFADLVIASYSGDSQDGPGFDGDEVYLVHGPVSAGGPIDTVAYVRYIGPSTAAEYIGTDAATWTNGAGGRAIVAVAPVADKVYWLDPDATGTIEVGSDSYTMATLIGESGSVAWFHALAAEHDVTGDGVADVLVAGGYGDGSAAGWLVDAMPSGTQTLEDSLRIDGEPPVGGGDWQVEMLPDLDGDGVPTTVLVDKTARAADGTSGAGRLHLFHGAVSTSTSVDFADLIVEGTLENENFGSIVFFAGDLDLDGVPDIGVGSPNGSVDRYQGGAVWMMRGDRTGTALSTDAYATISGESTELYLGFSAAGGADLDGDGLDEIAVGALGHTDAGVQTGGVFVFGPLGW